jgi:hypothetical protein
MYSESFMLIGAIMTLAALFVLTPVTLHVYGRYRDQRALRCPETGRLTSVQIDAGKAARSALFREPKLRIETCARWPERKSCNQKCLDIPPFPYRRAV